MMTFVVKETGCTPRLAKKAINDIARETVREMGAYWHDHFREKHFTQAGAREYGYATRQRGYMIAKARIHHHQNPLEFTGLSHALSKIKDIRATATSKEAKVRVVLHTPALNFIPRGGSINMRDEMTRISRDEAEQLARIAGQSQERQYNALNQTTTTTIG